MKKKQAPPPPLSIHAIEEAAQVLEGRIHRTPIQTSTALNNLCHAHLFFKCENFQKAGAFKIRGAAYTVLTLSEKEASCGVATHSSGNHGAALALAAQWRGIPATVVTPSNAPEVKQQAMQTYGAQLVFCEPSLEAREKTLNQVVQSTGAHFVSAYNDHSIIAGQGTLALEFLKQVPALDYLLCPVGGGGLLSGTALTCAFLSPHTKVIGVEPEQADDAYRSWKAGKLIPSTTPDTIADGLKVSLGTKTFPLIQKHVEAIVTVSEQAIRQAVQIIAERMKLVVEPSAAITLAALLSHRFEKKGSRIGLILSGGNVDLAQLFHVPGPSHSSTKRNSKT